MHRAFYLGCAGALAAVGILLLGVPLAFAAPKPVGTLTVNPTHGKPTARVNATFRVANAGHRCPSKAAFSWDGRSVGEADFDDTCTATRRFTPPDGHRSPGLHLVTATADDAHLSASATYLVDPVSNPSASPSASPTPSPTTPPTPRATSTGRTRPTPTPDLSTDNLTFTPAPESAPAAVAGEPASTRPVVQSSPPRTLLNTWTFVAGGGLVLVGAMAMGLLFLSSRRAAAEDTDTQLIPVTLDSLMPDRALAPQPPPTEDQQQATPEA